MQQPECSVGLPIAPEHFRDIMRPTMPSAARAMWGAILATNLAWVALLPATSAKLVALVGSVIAALMLGGRRLRARTAYPDSRRGAVAVAALFLLPLLSFLATPRVAFWILNGRSWLILAWLCAAVVLSRSGPGTPAVVAAQPRAASPATLLVILWSSAFWLAIVSDLGVARYAVESDRTIYQSCQSDPFATIYRIWETQPARDHLFLAWRTEQSFEEGTPYANHVHPYLFTMYAWSRAVRTATGLPQYVASNTTPFFYLAVLLAAVTTLLARLELLAHRSTLIGMTTLFFGCGLLVTGWRFWNDLYRYSTDNPFPLLAAVFIFVYAFLLEPVRPVAAAVSAGVFVALSPTNAPLVIVPVMCLFGVAAPTLREFVGRNRVLLAVSATVLVIATLTYLPPWLLSVRHGYTPIGSSVLFRSGLDGDTQYFSNLVQSIVAPCPLVCCWARSWFDLLYPAVLPLVVFGVLASRRSTTLVRLGHLLLFLCAPYLMTVILFPQAVSIHPYLYDHMLLLPAAVTATVAMLTPAVERKLHGVGLFAFLLFCGWVLMANLIGIAQAFAAMPLRP